MAQSDISTFAIKLEQTLGSAALNRLGKETGMAERFRQIQPARLATALISALGTQPVKYLSDILARFNELVEPHSVQYKPFHNQIKKEAFPRFTHGIFLSVLDKLVVDTLVPLPGSFLAGFDDIIIQDGSSFALHDKLAEVYPGRCSPPGRRRSQRA